MKIPLGDDHLIMRGGGLALLVREDYLFSSRARPENLFPGKPEDRIFIFNRNKFLKNQKIKKGGGC